MTSGTGNPESGSRRTGGQSDRVLARAFSPVRPPRGARGELAGTVPAALPGPFVQGLIEKGWRCPASRDLRKELPTQMSR